MLKGYKPADLSPESLSLLQIHQAEFIPHGVDLDYDYWNHGLLTLQSALEPYLRNNSEEILHAILPEELLDGAPVGYALTGHLGEKLLTLPWFHCSVLNNKF